MNDLPPVFRDQRKVDDNHLKLLSIFHFVVAGFAALGILFLIAHYTIFHFLFTNPKMWENQKGGPPPAEIFAVFKWFYLVGALWCVAFGVLNVLSGLFIRARKHWIFSMFVAGLNCVHIPLGTVLGVFTIIVLIRDSVGESYGD